MVAMTRGTIAVVAAMVVAGCSGGESQEKASTDVDTAARPWVDAIDEAARAGS